jgi:hypothetical protein
LDSEKRTASSANNNKYIDIWSGVMQAFGSSCKNISISFKNVENIIGEVISIGDS